MNMDIDTDTISLPTNKMNDLLFLCAHDFKHDFLEDKERSGRAMGFSGYAGGATLTEVVTTQQTSPVLKIREYSDVPEYSDEPETFPLACYLYLILGETDFDDFCNKIDIFTEIIDEGNRKIEHDPKLKASRDRLQEKYDERKGGAKTRPANWDRKTGKEKYEYLLKTRRVKPNIEKQRRSGRARKIPQTLGTFDSSSVEPLSFNPKDAQKWDDYLEIYKEWLGGNEPEKLNKLNDETSQFPVKELKKSWLISSDDWSNVEVADTVLYNTWVRGVKRANFKSFFQGILKKSDLPPMSELQISKTNLSKLRNFGTVLLKEWGLFIENTSVEPIYNPTQLSELIYNDNKMWADSRIHYISKKKDNLLTNDISTPPGYRVPTPTLNLLASGKLINNSAPLSKYVGDTSEEDKLFQSQPSWICPIPSIIDPQSVCNNIPVAKENKVGDEFPDLYPEPFNIEVCEEGGDGNCNSLGGKKININIDKVEGTTSRYNPTISFQNHKGESIVGELDPVFHDFSNGGIALSAYNITKLFIDKFLDDDDERDLSPLVQYPQNKQILKDIMGIFAIKLMGDFSQELYSVSKINHNFVANDRVSAARYLLLKAHGSINSMPLIDLPGIGGYLSYSRPTNNYFLIQNISPGSPPSSRPTSPSTGVGGGKTKNEKGRFTRKKKKSLRKKKKHRDHKKLISKKYSKSKRKTKKYSSHKKLLSKKYSKSMKKSKKKK
jgi:hypothetical protein